jgi:hypothetical protein
VIIQMSGLAGMYDFESTGFDTFALNPRLFNSNSSHVPLLARPKADRKAISKNGSAQTLCDLARACIFDLWRFEMFGRNTLPVPDASVHECLYEQAFFTVFRAVL